MFGFKGDSVTDLEERDIYLDFKESAVPVKVLLHGAKFGKVRGEEVMLDENIVHSLYQTVSDTFDRINSKYCPKPQNVFIEVNGNVEHKENLSQTISDVRLDDTKIEVNLFNVINPSVAFEDVYLTSKEKENIEEVITIAKYRDKLFNEWKLGNKNGTRAVVLNFYGPSGTGKTMMAEAIGSYFGKKVLQVDYSQLESKYVGETPKNIKKAFEIATKEEAIIVFDEADSFLGKRLENVTQSSDYGVNVTRSVMLIELEKFDGIVIFTTNLIKNYDSAFKRRILASIEFKLPDYEGRKWLWEKYLSKDLPLDGNIDVEALAKDFDRISGADIKDILLTAAIKALKVDGDGATITYNQIKEAAFMIKKRYGEDNTDEVVSVETTTMSLDEYNKETANQ